MSIKKNLVLLLKAQTNDEKNDKYEVMLSDNGFEVIQVKSLDFKFKNLDLLKEKLDKSDEFAGMILSSPRCVQAVKFALGNSQLSDVWKQKLNYVVGEATHDLALKELGIECLGKETGNANNLSVNLLTDPTEKIFLYPHGNLKMDILKTKFEGTKLRLEEVEVYETIANENIATELSKVTDCFQMLPEYVVFFSPSGIRAMDKLLCYIPVKLTKFIAIGPTTETAMIEFGLPVFGTAKQPTPSDILKLIKS